MPSGPAWAPVAEPRAKDAGRRSQSDSSKASGVGVYFPSAGCAEAVGVPVSPVPFLLLASRSKTLRRVTAAGPHRCLRARGTNRASRHPRDRETYTVVFAAHSRRLGGRDSACLRVGLVAPLPRSAFVIAARRRRGEILLKGGDGRIADATGMIDRLGGTELRSDTQQPPHCEPTRRPCVRRGRDTMPWAGLRQHQGEVALGLRIVETQTGDVLATASQPHSDLGVVIGPAVIVA